MKDAKLVYVFGDGTKDDKALLGGKGANLSEMTSLGIPVPPGFTITTEVCDLYYKKGKKLPKELPEQVESAIKVVEKETGMRFGSKSNPLLVSVRSGAAVSMPGMMDTVLNLGLNDETVEALAEKTGNRRFAYDSYRRFIQMFADVVMGIDTSNFEYALGELKESKKAKYDTDLSADDLKSLVATYKDMVKEEAGNLFPSDPKEQLDLAIQAVFGSWNNRRAITYRRINRISGLKGTAVNVQAMVFGNMGETSSTGVCFSRNPSTGEKQFYGEFLVNAQGEDVVAGIRTPRPIKELEKVNPGAYRQLVGIYHDLEKHYKDMQDMEFTIQEGKLYMLQTRSGKRTAQAAVRIAVEMVKEGLLSREEALLKVDPNQLDQLLHKQIDQDSEKGEQIAKGLPASPGAAVGRVVFTAEDAEAWHSEGKKVVLVRTETSPEDIEGMHAAQGILTSRGGMTSHAAVVARGMGKCCVAGCDGIIIDEKARRFKAGDAEVKEGDWITLDGSTGEVMLGKAKLVEPTVSGDFSTLMGWADSVRRLKVRTNADTPHDSEVAVRFGAEGIGLCRTEHMFFEGDRIMAVRKMIVAKNEVERRKALAKLLPMQRSDFEGIFKAMGGRPVTIRLLDPPLHEFLPHEGEEIEALARELGVKSSELKGIVDSLRETNPMLGHRGCRLAITYPEIAEMQARAIMEAACNVKESGLDVRPEIMVPLVGIRAELTYLKDIIDKTAKLVLAENDVEMEYLVGTMIEVPRAALVADRIAEDAEFFSFGTNDLTQMTFGFSRDDVAKFVPEYVKKGLLAADPFQVLDQEAVGQLVAMAVEKGRMTRKSLKVGICGEHGGEPSSVEFCHRAGLDYVSCSPYRVPIARLAAAHAAIKN